MADDRPALSLAHSPDADDMAMWWPLTGAEAGGRPAIETGRFRFVPVAADVEELNRRAIAAAADGAGLGPGALDITAVSAAVYPAIAHAYAITAAGASFGDGYGPKVVTRGGASAVRDAAGLRSASSIAVPGRRTTAMLTLSLLLGEAREQIPFVEAPFDAVAGMVARGEVECGVLIHEAQLLIEREGLREVVDLGAWWKQVTGRPLPLGLNVVRRDLDARYGVGSVQEVAATLARSVQYARDHGEQTRRFLMMRAVDRPEWSDEGLLSRYLAMYMSDLTAEMGNVGAEALEELYRRAQGEGLIGSVPAVDVAGRA